MKLEQFTQNWTRYFEHHMRENDRQSRGEEFALEGTEQHFLGCMEFFIQCAKEQLNDGETLSIEEEQK
jgi:hypothetical protein